MKIIKYNIKEIIEKYEIRPKKKLGQNFIFDKNILNKITERIEPLNNFLIVEIGPGPGGLTNMLLKKKPKSILLIEKDLAFKKILEDLTSQFSKIDTKIMMQDFLKIDLYNSEIFKKNKVKFISNLPYYISTQILMKILPLEKNVYQLIFMFQKEVADRLLAKPNNKDYSRLSVITQYSCEIKKLFNIRASVFFPKPKVDSCLLSFTPKNKIRKDIFNAIKKITKLAFEKRRKTINNSLSSIEGINKLFINLKINPHFRAENISVEQYTALAVTAVKEKLI
ncbi:MAG: Ribosomal RNA small subunit methyltransferase A [Alphaproteobacteria bacterium MarineAlpha9_Bin4]|nr:MAG: Ribosomal RNA small subunit methyltransferase A [Alphaproteobacteria bacterium MarineAlpha9_Bin4]